VFGARLAHMDVRVNQPGKLDHAVSSGNRQKKRAMLMALLDKQWLVESGNPTRFGSPAHFRRLDKIQHRTILRRFNACQGGKSLPQDFPARLFLAIIARDALFAERDAGGEQTFGVGLPMPPAGNRKPAEAAPGWIFSPQEGPECRRGSGADVSNRSARRCCIASRVSGAQSTTAPPLTSLTVNQWLATAVGATKMR
jgi:hypothetical protein